MPTFAVTSIGVDQPGIVAMVTGVLLEHGCNLEDTAMSVLRGQFAMVMVVAAPEGADAVELESELRERVSRFDLVTVVRPLQEAPASALATADGVGADGVPVDGEAWTVVVYGPDNPGIVHLVAEQLAVMEINIVDVTTRVSGADGALYSMVMEVVPPEGLEPADAEAALADATAAEGLTVRITPSDADLF